MYRLSKIPEVHRPEIISSDVSDDRFLTFIVQDWSYRKILRKDVSVSAGSVAPRARLAAARPTAACAARAAAAHAAAASAAASTASAEAAARALLAAAVAIYAVDIAWESSYWHNSGSFKDIIDKNIPCVVMHKVKNNWAPEIDTVVCFMTGDTLDVFLVHPKDLTEWDPNEEIKSEE